MRKEVHWYTSDRRHRAIDKHKAATNIVSSNFEVGNFVVIFKAINPAKKLSFFWYCSCRIRSVKRLAVCTVKDLIVRKNDNVRTTRIEKNCGLLHESEAPSNFLDLANRFVEK